MQAVEKKDLRIVFIGTSGEGSIQALDAINRIVPVVGVIESYRRIKKISLIDKYNKRRSALKRKAGADVPYLWTTDLNDKKTEKFIKDLGSSLICICSAYQLIKQNIIDIPEFGVLNAHGAILPDYRGAYPDYYIFRNFEHEGG